ncbi:hypothetical protein DOTSEDRAFT_130829, partial [Dothistroma septosporum NZE10]
QGYDFFQPQLIRHARAYCLYNVLHNQNDGMCLQILANVRKAMKSEYSKLIVSSTVIGHQKVSSLQSGLDTTMLVVHSGRQRSRKQWEKLVRSAGFSVVSIWMAPAVGNGIV